MFEIIAIIVLCEQRLGQFLFRFFALNDCLAHDQEIVPGSTPALYYIIRIKFKRSRQRGAAVWSVVFTTTMIAKLTVQLPT